MFAPQWEGPVKGWATKHIRKNKWRIDPVFEASDLMQDAYLLFLKLVRYYPSVETPSHFMALYKTALSRQIIDHARRWKLVNEIIDTTRQPHLSHQRSRRQYWVGGIEFSSDCPVYDNWGYVAAAIVGAPKELKQALNVYMNRDTVVEPATARRTRKQLMELLA